MKYENPVILSDYSDPDVIRVGDDFYMVASSFNHVPGVPVLHSKNLVEWEIVNYVLDALPFEKYGKVCHGEGAWAPSLRYHSGKFYCLIPFPDEGIFVAEADDPYGKWSLLRPLLTGAGYEDPCPVWADGKCYVVFAFVKSRIGFNSRLAVIEADEELKEVKGGYKIIYDGRDLAPRIEGPKIYRHGKYFYILAPAGGVKTGWQVALRSEKIYGEWETKIVLMQGDTAVNGPHQGALIDLDDAGEKWAFMHFQDIGAYGRVVHLQPAEWLNDWIIIGNHDGDGLAGTPVAGGEYPVDIRTGAKINPSDEFDGDRLSLVWQTPANRREEWFSFKRGLKLICCPFEKSALSDLPQLIMQKVQYKNFAVNAKCKLNLINDGDEVGFTVFGKSYAYVCVVRRGGQNFLEIRKGGIGGEEDETLAKSQSYDEGSVTFKLSAKFESPNLLAFKFSFGGSAFTHKFYAEEGVWTGAKIGIYARGAEEKSKGNAIFKYFRVTCTDNRIRD